MSVGHDHKAPNMLAHTRELKRLLTTGDAPQLMQRWSRFDPDHDIPYLCGYNVQGTTRYADRDFVHALYDPKYAEHIIGQPIDTGLTAEQTLECALRHEAIEKVLLDADNPVNDYQGAHEFATAGEHDKVRSFGGTPFRYERGLERIIKYCQSKPVRSVPRDLDCAPYLDDPDATDHRLLAEFRKLGVTDASKVSKKSVAYRHDTAGDRCAGCSMWKARDRHVPLSACSLVEGLVRQDRVCDKFEPEATTLDAVQEAARPKEKVNG